MKRPTKAPALKNGKPRNYRKEYDDYHGKPEQVKLRGERNAARAEAQHVLGMKLPTDIEVDHKDPLSQGGSNALANLELMPRHMNRRKATSTYNYMRPQRERTEVQPLDLGAALAALHDYRWT
tara:strand:- start:5489 stop:5857 length:369 start_codon:yes stop_codon:yes gene_type:complete